VKFTLNHVVEIAENAKLAAASKATVEALNGSLARATATISARDEVIGALKQQLADTLAGDLNRYFHTNQHSFASALLGCIIRQMLLSCTPPLQAVCRTCVFVLMLAADICDNFERFDVSLIRIIQH
jgi:ABC-type transporter Mla subunit MlaD